MTIDHRADAPHASASKIVFVNRYFHPDQSATSQMLTDLATGLAAGGREVHVVCSRQMYDDPKKRLPRDDTVLGVHVHRVATTRFGRSLLPGRAMDYASFYVTCAVMLLTLLRRNDVLVVKTDPPLLSLLASPIAGHKRASLINWQQDVFPEIASQLGVNPLPQWLNRRLKRWRDRSLAAARMNVVIGQRMREYLAARGIPESKLSVIDNWADDRAIEPKSTAASTLRMGLGLGDRFVVCYSGNLGRAHEFDTLLGAAQLLESKSRFVFLMIGDGAKMAGLKRAVAARALENFRFLPYQPRESLQDGLAAADLHLVSLLPSMEGLIVPSKLYGILAAGRPVIFIGDLDGDTSRLIGRAQCGRPVSVGDSEGLARLLLELEADSDQRTLMGHQARRVLSDEFSLRHALESWRGVIDDARHS